MRIEVTPTELNIKPILVGGIPIIVILGVMEKTWLRYRPLVSRKEDQIGTAAVHLVGLTRVDGLLLDGFDLEGIQLLIEYLANIHGNGLMDLLPKMRSEDLNQRDLERWNLTVHEDTGEVELDLETNVHIGSVDGRRPPQGEATIGDLSQTGSLGIGKLLELHALLEAGGLLPEQTLPRWEVCTLEEGVLQNTLNSTKRLNHVGTVGVEIPQFAIVALMSPPEGVDTKHLILLEDGPNSPTSIVGKSVPILAKEGVNARNTPVPRIFEIFNRQTAILGVGLLTLQGILGPNSLRVDELTFPGLQVAEQVGNQLVRITVVDFQREKKKRKEEGNISGIG